MEWNRICLEQKLKDFSRNDEMDELSLPPIFKSADRLHIHKLCFNMGLISKSKGSKRNPSVLVTKRSVFEKYTVDPKSSVISKSDNLLTSQANQNGCFMGTLDLFEKTAQFLAQSRWIASLTNGKNPTTADTYALKANFVSESANACRVHDRLSLPPPEVPSLPINNDLRAKLMKERVALPIMAHRARILRVMDQNQVCLVVGETGSGKSTQVPQFLLEQAAENNRKCRIVITEPRRIAAITLAERCSNERGETVGDTVGYQIRLEKDVSPKTLLTFCTIGIVLRTLIGAQATLLNITHIIIDEVHERGKMSDFLLTVLREILPKYPHLRLILMSASLDIEKFEHYFQNSAILDVPGRLYDVQEHFLEDVLKVTNYKSGRGFSGRTGDFRDENSSEDELENVPGEHPFSGLDDADPDCKLLSEYFGETGDDDQIDVMLIIELMNFILSNSQIGAILVFLPGYEDLTSVRDHILMDARLMKSNLTICILHSLMMPNDQKEAFLPTPEGSRKIVLSTNIAEVSVTINDVVHVIDCGKMKEKNFDSCSGVSMLSNVWVSKANALQRKGRVGRCSTGYCYRLYSRLRYKYMPNTSVPEILRVPIHELCLQTKLLFPEISNVQNLLSKAPDSPSPANLSSAISLLKSIGAMTDEENLTLLGRELAELPADPQFAKMLLFGVLLKCVDPILTIVACLSYQDPFILPTVKDDRRKITEVRCALSADMYSDHLVYLRAYDGWYSAYMNSNERQYCSQNFLSPSSMNMIDGIKSQLRSQLYRLGYLGNSDSEECYNRFNTNRNNWPVIKAALVAGSYPFLAFVDKEKRKIRTKRTAAGISPHSTVLKGKCCSISRQTKLLPVDWLVYNELVQIHCSVQMKCATAVTPLTMCLFSGPIQLTTSDAWKTVKQQESMIESREDRSSGFEGFDVVENDVIQIEDLVFKTDKQTKNILHLREKIFSLFLKMLRDPRNCDDEDSKEVLQLLSDILNAEDERFGLVPVKKSGFRKGFNGNNHLDDEKYLGGNGSTNSAGFSNNPSTSGYGNGSGNGTIAPPGPGGAGGSYYHTKSYVHGDGKSRRY